MYGLQAVVDWEEDDNMQVSIWKKGDAVASSLIYFRRLCFKELQNTGRTL
jgi:hypothetical protein